MSKTKHAGTGTFVAQRVTALGLLILIPWFIVTIALSMPDAGYVSASDFLTRPFEAIGLILLLAIGLYHMRIGMGEVIEDYIHKPSTKSALELLNTLVVAAMGLAALYALYVVNFGD
jgi:succinate dehydrogenase / fumarate reductase membrane anchor subunit